MSRRAPQVNQRAAELARQAASTRAGVLVAGSIGPTGLLMKPYGPLTVEETIADLRRTGQSPDRRWVDLLVIETMFAFEEADAAFKGARSVTDLPIVVSFSYDRGVRSMMGVKPVDMFKHYKEMGAVMIGANLRYHPWKTWKRSSRNMPRPDPASRCGPSRTPACRTLVGWGGRFSDVTPEQMAEYALKYVALGAKVVGGCCGNMPGHIAAIAKGGQVKNASGCATSGTCLPEDSRTPGLSIALPAGGLQPGQRLLPAWSAQFLQPSTHLDGYPDRGCQRHPSGGHSSGRSPNWRPRLSPTATVLSPDFWEKTAGHSRAGQPARA